MRAQKQRSSRRRPAFQRAHVETAAHLRHHAPQCSSAFIQRAQLKSAQPSGGMARSHAPIEPRAPSRDGTYSPAEMNPLQFEMNQR
jgi:hypothetical protein